MEERRIDLTVAGSAVTRVEATTLCMSRAKLACTAIMAIKNGTVRSQIAHESVLKRQSKLWKVYFGALFSVFFVSSIL